MVKLIDDTFYQAIEDNCVHCVKETEAKCGQHMKYRLV
jgi:hypothetical protein